MVQPYEIEVYVRFCETDAIGHVNNTSHFLYFEEARTRFFNVVNPNKDDSFTFITANINCTYLNEAFSGQTLKVETTICKIGTTSFILKQILRNTEMNILVAEAETVMVCFDYPNKASIKIPNFLYSNLERYYLKTANKY